MSIAVVGLVASCADGRTESQESADSVISNFTSTEGPVVPSAAGRFPSGVDATSRYLIDQHGEPWLGVGDTAWSLVGQLSLEDIVTYLDNRAAKGVNLVLLSAPEAHYADDAPRNHYGAEPFTGAPFQSSLNDDYWKLVDFAVDYAASLGITLLICPIYIGYNGDGWQSELESATNAQMSDYGAALAERYGARPNVMWDIGHDKEDLSDTLKERGAAVAEALRHGTTDLVTASSFRRRDVNGTTTFGIGSEEWDGSGVQLDFDTQYDYSAWIAENSKAMWEMTPPVPFIFFEGKYEQEVPNPPLPIGDVLLREQMWASFCNGATGQIWGNNPIWGLGTKQLYSSYEGSWQENMDYEGSRHLEKFAEITAVIGPGWASTQQDETSTFITNQGSGSDRVAARFDHDLGLVYHPNFTSGSIDVDLTEFASAWPAATVTRYDPTSGEATLVGTYGTSGMESIDAPPANARGDRDWLFVVRGVPQ